MPFTLPDWTVLKTLLEHATDVPAILAAVQAVNDADPQDKWESLKHLGDLLEPVALELLGFQHDGAYAAAGDCEGLCAAKGFDWSKIQELLPKIVDIVSVLVMLLK